MRHLQSYLTKIFSAISITPASQNVYTYDDHMINCKLDDIPSQLTGIEWGHAIDYPRPWITSNFMAMMWNPVMKLPNAYSLEDGTISGSSQTAKLTITSPRLTLLKESAKVHLFTCKYEFGGRPGHPAHREHPTTISAVQSVTLFSPSKFFLCPLETKIKFRSEYCVMFRLHFR